MDCFEEKYFVKNIFVNLFTCFKGPTLRDFISQMGDLTNFCLRENILYKIFCSVCVRAKDYSSNNILLMDCKLTSFAHLVPESKLVTEQLHHTMQRVMIGGTEGLQEISYKNFI